MDVRKVDGKSPPVETFITRNDHSLFADDCFEQHDTYGIVVKGNWRACLKEPVFFNNGKVCYKLLGQNFVAVDRDGRVIMATQEELDKKYWPKMGQYRRKAQPAKQAAKHHEFNRKSVARISKDDLNALITVQASECTEIEFSVPHAAYGRIVLPGWFEKYTVNVKSNGAHSYIINDVEFYAITPQGFLHTSTGLVKDESIEYNYSYNRTAQQAYEADVSSNITEDRERTMGVDAQEHIYMVCHESQDPEGVYYDGGIGFIEDREGKPFIVFTVEGKPLLQRLKNGDRCKIMNAEERERVLEDCKEWNMCMKSGSRPEVRPNIAHLIFAADCED
jgi:hypothetical protein